jgi:hypothetical protein
VQNVTAKGWVGGTILRWGSGLASLARQETQNMLFEIKRLALGCRTALPIDEADFKAVRNCRKALLLLLQIEISYDVLVGNWLQLEQAACFLAFDMFARVRLSRAEMERDHTELNRHIVNLLSAARSFIDHTKRHLASFPDCTPADKAHLKDVFASQYDTSLSYRAAENLRNYTQHCGLPTQGFSSGLHWKGEPEADKKLVSSVSPYLTLDRLRSDTRFKKQVLEELAAVAGNEVPVMPILREYVGSLSSVMQEARQLFAARQESSANTLDSWVERFCQTESRGETKGVGVAARQLDETGESVEEIHLDIELRERLHALQSTNRQLMNVHKLQVIS